MIYQTIYPIVVQNKMLPRAISCNTWTYVQSTKIKILVFYFFLYETYICPFLFQIILLNLFTIMSITVLSLNHQLPLTVCWCESTKPFHLCVLYANVASHISNFLLQYYDISMNSCKGNILNGSV